MRAQDSPVSLFSLDEAIDLRPLTTSQDATVAQAIAMMGKAQSSCNTPSLNLSLNTELMSQARASAIVVVDGKQVVGVFAETDAIRAIASDTSLARQPITQWMRESVTTLVKPDAHTVFDALSLMRQQQIQHLPVVSEHQHLIGMITLPGIRRVLQVDELLKSRLLKDIVTSSVVSVSASTSAQDLAQKMASHQVAHLVVVDDAEAKPIGLVSERDLILLQSLQIDLNHISARTIMSYPLVCCAASTSILEAYWEMQQQRVKQFVITADHNDSVTPGTLLSIATPTSFLYGLALDDMRQTAEHLQQSITAFSAEAGTSLDRSFEEPDEASETLLKLQCSHLLTTMALRIRESLDLSAILQTAVDEVRQFLQTDRVIIYRFNSDMSGTVAVESVAAGWRPALYSTIQDTCFGQDYAQPYREGRIQVTSDIYAAGLTQCHIDILVLYDIRAALVVPILQGNHLWGLLCAYHCSGPRDWRPFEVDLLKQLATHMAIAIQQSELYQQVQVELAERKRAEEEIKISLREKESLLKEVHHRVKNNLQIISSLLRLQSDYIKDENALTLFRDSQNRIRSMALIHEKLYQSKDVLRIDFSEYIHDLSANLLRSYMASSQPIHLQIDADDIWLNIDTAIPCGLIINELISNALKHAFPVANQDNIISIDVHKIGDNRYKLTVSDNGVGFPQDLNFRDTDSLGLQLVCTFTEQLEGTIELEGNNGTRFTILLAEVGSARKAEGNG